jgi:hypothetical protein
MKIKPLISYLLPLLGMALTIISMLFPIFSGTSGTYGNWDAYLYGQIVSVMGTFPISDALGLAIWAILIFFTIFAIFGAGISTLTVFIRKILTTELRIIGGIMTTITYILVFIIGAIFLEFHGQVYKFGAGIFIGMFAGVVCIISGFLEIWIKE